MKNLGLYWLVEQRKSGMVKFLGFFNGDAGDQ